MSYVMWFVKHSRVFGLSLALLGLAFPVPLAWAQGELAGEVVSVDGSVFIRPDGKEARKLASAKPGDKVFSGDVINTPSNGKVKILMKDKSIVDIGPSALFKVDHFAANGGGDRQADVSMMYGTMRASITQKLQGKGRFKVRTAAATMGVRGTEFVVKSEIPDMEHLRAMVLGKPMPEPPKAEAASGEPGEKGKNVPPGQEKPKRQEAKTEITVLQGQVDVVKEAPKPAAPKDGSRAPAAVPPPQVVSLTAGTQLVTAKSDIAPAKPVVLDAAQLTNITKEVRVADNTFSKAVTLDLSAKADGGAVGDSAGSGPMLPIIPIPPPTEVPFDPSIISGGFDDKSTFTDGQDNTGQLNKTLRITVKWRQ